MRAAVAALLAVVMACAGRSPAVSLGPPPATTPAAPAPAPAPTPPPARPGDERAALRGAIDSLVGSPRFRSALWGILIVDPVRAETLYAHNEAKVFVPASNQKIVTGAVALAQLGADYRYRTDFLARGPVRDGVLRGDLLVAGRGDPSVSDRMRGEAMVPLREIADSLAARGIRRITGSVRATGDVFTDARYGEGWSWDDFDYYYSAPVDELLINESSSTVIVRGGARRGAAAVTRVIPAATYPPFRYEIRTVGGAGHPDEQTELRALFDSVSGGYLIRGTIRAGESLSVDVAHHDPVRGYLTALSDAIRERGIAIGGARSDTGARVDTLFHTMSPPLREILPAFEKKSQNQIGEILLKTLGLERTGAGTADSGLAVVRRQLLAWGADSDGFSAHDGSGLSRLNYVSPRTIVRVLERMRGDSAYSAFPAALPIAGVDGTIRARMKGGPAEGNVRAKTGSVQRARSLSGYVTTADGRELVFSFLCNGFMTPAEEVEAAQDSIANMLAGARLGDR